MKLSKSTLFLGASLLGLAPLLSSALTAAPLQDPEAPAAEKVAPLTTAREVIDRYLEVTGTRAFAPKYESQKSLGKIEIVGMGIKGSVEEYHMKPALMRVNVEMDMVGKVRSGSDGKTAWRIHPMLGEQILEGAELEQLQRRSIPFSSAFKNAKDFETIEFLGEAVFEEQACYKLRFVETPYAGLKPEESREIREYFEYYDIDTGYLVGTTAVAASSMGDIPTTTTYGDYRKFGEVIVHTRSLITMQGQKILATVLMVEFNTVKKGVFTLPVEIEALVKTEDAEDTEEPVEEETVEEEIGGETDG
jgi:hypothetical protein